MTTDVLFDCEISPLLQPQLLSIGVVTRDGRECYVELDLASESGKARLAETAWDVRDGVVKNKWGLFPDAICTSEAAMGIRAGEWLLAIAASDAGGRIVLMFGCSTDYELLVGALEECCRWPRVRAVTSIRSIANETGFGGRIPLDVLDQQDSLELKSNYSNPDEISRLLGRRDGSTAAQVGVEASWEPDLWGAVRRAVESDTASLEADRAAYQATRVSLSAMVACTYLNLRTLDLRIHVARANVNAQAENLRIATARVKAGEASELDVRQATMQLHVTTSQIAPLESSFKQQMHALSVLLGQTPDSHERSRQPFTGELTLPKDLPLGVPHDLLRRRPDVVQAERAAAAQSARIGQSQAALYPSFTLSGSFGTQSSTSGSNSIGLFSWGNRMVSAGAGLVLPIFDRGRLHAQVNVQDALFRRAIFAYQGQVLKAQQEVEDALAGIRGSQAAELDLQLARTNADRAFALALERYKAGETDFTTVTAAAQSLLQVEDIRFDDRRNPTIEPLLPSTIVPIGNSDMCASETSLGTMTGVFAGTSTRRKKVKIPKAEAA